VPDEDPREQLISLEKLRRALATTQAQANELHVRVVRLLERAVADDVREAAERPPRRPSR
jgi:hypothetical protein